MNVRDRVNRLELLLKKIQKQVRSRGTGIPYLEKLNARIEGDFSSAAAQVSSPASDPPIERPASHRVFHGESVTGTLELVETGPSEILSEEDVLEMPSDVLESAPPLGVMAAIPPVFPVGFRETLSRDLEFQEEEEPPDSSERHRITGTLDQAVALAADEQVLIDDGHEVPVKTPPPESGPQQAPMAAPFPGHDVRDFGTSTQGLSSRDVLFVGPSLEQLGQTIELEQAPGPPLELDAPLAPMLEAFQIPEELEVTLPAGEFAGKYDEALQPPPEAQNELQEHRRKSGELQVPAHELPARDNNERTSSPAPGQVDFVTVPAPGREPPFDRAEESHLTDVSQMIPRAPLSNATVVEFRASPPRIDRSLSFLELLDESLRST